MFCVANAKDPVVPLIESMIAQHAGVGARLLIGDDRISANPKLNNVLKGWRAAQARLDRSCRFKCAVAARLYRAAVCQLARATPASSLRRRSAARPQGLWAELECAFLNTYQARWQYIADAFGCGFAQGKTMLWRRGDLERAGGIETLANEVAEDAAATKIVRGAGRKVRLVDRPFPQPLGYRSAREVWYRQLRWARLRRASFFAYFLPEALSGGALPMLALAFAAPALGLPPALSVISSRVLVWGGNVACARRRLARLRALPAFCLARDLLLPVLFVGALFGDGFVWRGNEMQVERLRPRALPALNELAPVARRRLRSLRERMS